MELKIFAVYDAQTKVFSQPFVQITSGAAARMFQDQVNQKGHAWNTHPSDYTLYELGKYDDTTGHVQSIQAHSHGLATAYLNEES